MITYCPLTLQLSTEQSAALQDLYAVLGEMLEKSLPIPHDLHQHFKARLQAVLEAQEHWLSWAADTYIQRVLHLQHPDPQVLNLPWELALEGYPQIFLSKSPFPLAPAYVPNNPLPLKILVMVSSPEDSTVRSRLSFEEEELSILRAFAALFETGQVQLDFTEDGSLANLRKKLHDNHYHILHFSGHGVYHEGQVYLKLENPDTLQRQLCSAREFATALSVYPEHLPALVLLSSCQTAQGGQDSNFSGVAQELLRAKVPAVLAMGWSILDHYANVFAEAFYEALAERVALPQAFRQAVQVVQKAQNQDLAQRQIPGLASQWFIPQLYCLPAVDKIANLEKREKKLHRSPVQFQMIEHPKGYYFVGRRRDKRALLPVLFAQQPIWLQGQGGLGKSSLAEHLVQRLLARYPELPYFILDETSADILALRGMLYDYFKKERKRFTIEIDAQRYSEEAPKQVLWLLTELAQVCTPIFIFDNLESFQVDEGNPEFAQQHEALLELLQVLASNRLGYLLCTGRYPAPAALSAHFLMHPLQEVRFVDFWKKTQQLRLVTLRQNLLQQQKVAPTHSPQLASYEDLIEWLHRTFGGNYRALEFFDEYFAQDPGKTSQLLNDLEQFPQLYQNETQATLQRMSANLVFDRLLALLSPLELQTLGYLRQFRRPVLPMALSMQDNIPEYLPVLQRLLDLTLLEEHTLPGSPDLLTYYAPPLVKNLLEEAKLESPVFSQLKAGAYFEYVDAELRQKNYSDLEEAFEHYSRVRYIEGLNRCGLGLSNGYYGANVFTKALYFSICTIELLGENIDWQILNRAGLIFDLLGEYSRAQQLYQQSLQLVRQISNCAGEGTILNNISQIYDAQGDYNTALDYLEQSLAIYQQIDDLKEEGTALNNIGQIYKSKGDYKRALQYLEQSLAIHQQVNNRSGEGTVLNNISNIYKMRGDMVKALTYLEQSLIIYRQVKNWKGESTVLNNFSQIYKTMGDYDLALKYLKQSLAIQQQIGNRPSESTILNNIAGIYQKRGEYDLALSHLKQSLAISLQLGNLSGEGIILNNIGQIYKIKGDYDLALHYLDQSLGIRQQIGDRSGESTTLHNIAGIYLVKKDEDLALVYLERSLTIKQEIGNRLDEGNTLNSISQVYVAKKEYDTALLYLNQSLIIQQQINDKSGLCVTWHNMATIYLDQQDDLNKYLELEVLAYQTAREIGDVNAIYQVGKYLGKVLCLSGVNEQGLPILQTAYQVGLQAGYPDVEEVGALIRQYGGG